MKSTVIIVKLTLTIHRQSLETFIVPGAWTFIKPPVQTPHRPTVEMDKINIFLNASFLLLRASSQENLSNHGTLGFLFFLILIQSSPTK